MERRHSAIEVSRAPLAVLAAFGAYGLGLYMFNESRVQPTASQVAIAQGCLPDGTPLPSQDASNPAGYGDTVQAMNQTLFFTTPMQYEYSIDAGLRTEYEAAITKARDGVPVGQIPPARIRNRMLAEDTKDSKEYEANLNIAAGNFLASKGITVRVEGKKEVNNLNAYLSAGGYMGLGQGGNSAVLGALAFLPNSVVQASGVNEIVFKSGADSNAVYSTPEIEGGTMYVGDPPQITEGVAEMTLDSCPDKAAILQQFVDITHEAGASYNDTPNLSSNKPVPKSRLKKYGSVFASASDSSPEAEFDDIFSNAIMGWNQFNDPHTPLGKKQQLVQAIFDRIQPHGLAWEEFEDLAGYYGNQNGLPPQLLAQAMSHLFTQVSQAKTQAAAKYDLEVYEGEVEPSPQPQFLTHHLFSYVMPINLSPDN